VVGLKVLIIGRLPMMGGAAFMGLFSDYLEENRDRVGSGEIDPCLILSSNYGFNNYDTVYGSLDKYVEYANNIKAQNEIGKELINNLPELEKIKAEYLVASKIMLKCLNNLDLQTELVSDILETLEKQLDQAYKQICKLRKDIDNKIKIGSREIAVLPLEPESSIQKRLLKQIMNCILVHMSNGVIINTSECRRVINDASNIIRSLLMENYAWPNKKVFAYYLEKQFQAKKGKTRCKNCGELLYREIPYCINCFERNL